MDNILLDTDSYKTSHYLQYPPGTVGQFSYVESRGGQYDKTLFFGLQYILKKYLSKPITLQNVAEAEEFYKAHGVPFNKEGWLHVLTDHGGKLPLKIRAIPEGSIVPTHNVLMTVENTCPKCFWATSYFETMLMRIWYPVTVATRSWHAKRIIYKALKDSCDNPDAEIPFKLHDFGARGVSSQESAAIGGAAHLVNFMGSDTVAGVYLANKFYGAGMAGFSIPASEHSTITAWGKDHEEDAFRNMLKQFAKPGAIVACVSDSYDIWNAADHLWGEKLRQEVIDSGAVVVVRPDSGNPPAVVKQLLMTLDRRFGHTINQKGFKVLKNVRIIQGDGVNEQSIARCLDNTLGEGFSAENLAFGMGGALLQNMTRDTQRFAYKCSAIKVDHGTFGGWVPVNKQPVGDQTKWSKAGLLDLVKVDGEFKTVVTTYGQKWDSVLQTVFYNGDMVGDQNFADIRKLANEGLNEPQVEAKAEEARDNGVV